MAEHDRDEELSRRYRDLAREEPPRALDDAILAAARREVRSHPAPLVAPSGRRRWFVPVAAAAVIVLSAVVTLHVQREQPGIDSPEYAPPPAARKDEAPPPAVAPRAEMREEQVAPKAKKDIDALYSKVEPQKGQPERRQRQAAPAPEPVAPSQAPAGEPSPLARAPVEAKPAEQERFSPDPGRVAAAPAPPPAPQAQVQPSAPAAQPAPRAADSAGAAAGAAPPAAAENRRAFGGLRDSPRLDQRTLAKREAQVEPPEKMLERIATLRREGRDKEADDLYAEFKRRYPDYRIPDALHEQVLPR